MKHYDLFLAKNLAKSGVKESNSSRTNAFSIFKRKIKNKQAASLFVWGDSTGNDSTVPREWPWLLADRLAASSPFHTVEVILWNDATPGWNAAVTVQTGTNGGSAPKITIWNCSIPGTATHYLLGSQFTASIGSVPTPDGLIINHGHNHVTGTDQYMVTGELISAIETYRAFNPNVPITGILQNPRQDTSVMDLAAQCWPAVAGLEDIGLINIYNDFIYRGKPAGLYLDTTHPNQSGQDLWISKVWDHYNSAPTINSYNKTSLFSIANPSANLLTNGDFSSYPTAPGLPPGWTSGGAGTLTVDKETTIKAPNASYSVKLTATGNSARIEQSLSGIISSLRGKRVTAAVRRYIGNEAGAGTVGRMQLVAQSASAGNPFITSRSYVLKQGGWVWWILPGFFVPTDSVNLTLRLYHDTAASPSVDAVYFDQASLVIGDRPLITRV